MKILSLFDGISVARVGIEKAGIKIDSYKACEIDKYAIQVAKKNYPDTVHLGSVTELNANGMDIDLLIGGSPCFTAGTMILTNKGYKKIENISVGDLVLTHNKVYSHVEKIGNKQSETYKINMSGAFQITCSDEHPFYVRSMNRIWNKSKRTNERTFSEPTWKKAINLTKGDFIGIPILDSENDVIDKIDAWLLGRYTADGYLRCGIRTGRKNSEHHLLTFCVGKNKKDKFLTQDKYNVGIVDERTVYKYRIINERLHSLAKECGRGAENKKVPYFILNASKEIAESYLEGYMSGDGCYTNKKYKATSVSKELIMGISLLVSKVYKTGASVYKTNRQKTTIIEGRTVNQKDSYELTFQKENRKQNKYYNDGKFIWFPFKKTEPTGNIETVFNIQVANCHSYTANNVVVHNCQDLSIAKANRQGLQGQRSGLFYEYVRILKEAKPKYFILENVNSMPKEAKQTITQELFGVQPVMLDASLVSAQSRKRLFWVGKFVGDTYETVQIPLPEDRGIKLIDIIEQDVDEKYYVDREKSYCIDAHYGQGTNEKSYAKGRRQIVRIGELGKGGQGDRVYSTDGKSVTLSANGGGQGDKTGLYNTNGIRKLTPTECERLQSLPDCYTEGISNTQRYKCLGNAFNSDIIAHIIKHLSQ